MANAQSPPDGWEIDTGTWGTDLDRGTTFFQGIASLQLKNTSVAASVLSDFIPMRSSTASYPNTQSFWVRLQADSVAGGNTVKLELHTYDNTKSFLATTTPLNGVLNAINTWETYGRIATPNASAKWARWQITKAAQAFNVYVDLAPFEDNPPYISYTQTAAQNINDSTWTTIVFGTNTFVVDNAINYNAATGVASILEPGYYTICSTVNTDDSLGDGKALRIRVKLNDGTNNYYVYGTGNPIGANDKGLALVATTLPCNTGDTIAIEVWQDSGGAINLRDRNIAGNEIDYFCHYTICKHNN